MGNTSGAKYKHMLYNVSRAGAKSGNKLKKAIAWYISLLKKESIKGDSKRLYKTKIRADARLKKFGVTKAMIQKELERKGLKDLIK